LYEKAAEEEPEANKDNEATEAIWANTNSSPSLSQIALSKPKVNFGLLEMHLQLVSVLYMAVSFDLNTSSMILTLFDKTVKLNQIVILP
jgi:Rab3 GTPase-activating protein regulatory subunit C-terminus